MPIPREAGFDSAFSGYLIEGANFVVKNDQNTTLLNNATIVSASVNYRNAWVCKNLPSINASIKVFWNKLSSSVQTTLSTKNTPLCIFYTVAGKSTTEPIMLYIKNTSIDYEQRFATIELVDILQILTQDLMTISTLKYKGEIHISEWATFIKQATTLINAFVFEYDPYIIDFRSDRTLAEAIQEIAINTGSAICFEPIQVSSVWKMNIAFRKYTNSISYIVYPNINVRDVLNNAHTMASETTSIEVLSLYNMNIEPALTFDNIASTDVFYVGCNYMFGTNGVVQVYNQSGTAIGTAKCDTKGNIHFTATSWAGSQNIRVAITLNTDNITQYATTNNTLILSSMTHDLSINNNIKQEAEAYYENDEYLEYKCRLNPAIIPLDNASGVLVEEVKLEYNGAYSGTIKGRKVKTQRLIYIEVVDPQSSYIQGDDFVKPTVIAYFNDGTNATVTNDCTFSGYNLSNYGSQVVNVSYTYGGVTKTTAYSIIVVKLVPTSLSLGTKKTSYYTGDTFSKPSSATATFNNGSTSTVTNSVVYSGYNLNTAGTQTVTASYTYNGTTVTTTYQIVVTQKKVTSIALSNITYKQGYNVDLIKPTVTATYNNGTTAVVTNDTTFTGYNKTTYGVQTVTASYSYGGNTRTATFQVEVVLLPPEYSWYEMTHYPRPYWLNLSLFNPNGVAGTIYLSYSNGTMSWSVDGSSELFFDGGGDMEEADPVIVELWSSYVNEQAGTLYNNVVIWFVDGGGNESEHIIILGS